MKNNSKTGKNLEKKQLNKKWHEENVLGTNQSLEKRITWHLEHEKHCNCRKMPESIRKEIQKRNLG